jgi:Fuc2NAc and GlcNAc transferase
LSYLAPLAASLIAFTVALIGTRAFVRFAVSNGIVANPNFRSLHERPIPRAGGVVFSMTFLVTATILGVVLGADRALMLTLLGGGAGAALVGLLDDILQVGALTQLGAQAVLAAFCLWAAGNQPVVDLPWSPQWLDLVLNWAGFVWLLNLYNFMDGVDGMAATGSVFFSVTVMLLLVLSDVDTTLLALLAVLVASVLAFTFLNWPPATIFMGSTGSYFLGYCYCALIVYTVTRGQMSFWAWVVIFGYFAGDTTTTTLVRMFITDRWYGEHRSHAYQNLARVWRSHKRVVTGVMAYHVLWLLPLALLMTFAPRATPVAVALAFAPVVLWALRFGPRFSSS